MKELNVTNPIVFKSPTNGSLNTALDVAAQYGQLGILEFIADQLGDINPYNNAGETPLHYAVFYNKTDIVKYYLESNITDKNPRSKSNDKYRGRTPLHDASQRGFIEIVKLILPFIKDKNPADDSLITPLHMAALTQCAHSIREGEVASK